MGFATFDTLEQKKHFLRGLREKQPFYYQDRKLWVGDDKDKTERYKDRCVAKLKKVLLSFDEDNANLQNSIDRSFNRGIVWIGKVRVGEWQPLKEEFKVWTERIDGLKLGFTGNDVLDAWNAEIGL